MNKQTKKSPQELANEIVRRQSDLYEASENILGRLAEGDLQTVEDAIIFDALNWDKNRILRETARFQRSREVLQAAGTRSDLEKAKTIAAELSAKSAERLPQLQEQIATLQQECDRLTRMEREANADVERRTRLRLELRERVPKHIRDESDRMRLAANLAFTNACGEEAGETGSNRIGSVARLAKRRSLRQSH
jgi:hypothetical protein